jgi:hypothetical protein
MSCFLSEKGDSALKNILDVSPKAASGALQFTIGALKTAHSTIKSATNQAKETVQQQMKLGAGGPLDPSSRPLNQERLQRRVYEEAVKLFNEPDSLYYSSTGDLSRSVQARLSERAARKNQQEEPSNPAPGTSAVEDVGSRYFLVLVVWYFASKLDAPDNDFTSRMNTKPLDANCSSVLCYGFWKHVWGDTYGRVRKLTF